MQFFKKFLKDLGLQREVVEALPYAVVGGAWESSLISPITASQVLLSHIVPHGQQLKILFLRIWTQESAGAIFSIQQSNPAAAGATGTVEAYPVVGSVPSGTRDWPMLEAAGAEVLHGTLEQPIHVLEGSVDFKLHWTPTPCTAARYSLTWWGVEKIPEP